MAIESYWNPAFRPNTLDSSSNTASIEQPEHQAPVAPTEEISSDDEAYLLNYNDQYSKEPSRSIETFASKESHPQTDATNEDNTEHPELGSLRDALATSLTSPGGVELEERVVQEQAQSAEVAASETVLRKANFPSKGPAHDHGHSSAESFSRTVSQESQEANWGEDDEVDPEWNLQRTGTDPFKFMAPSDRTNSFPAVQPARSKPAKPEEPLPHSQAESVMKELEESNDPFEDGEPDDDFFSQNPNNYDSANTMESVMENGDEKVLGDDYGKSYGGDTGDQDVGARFEEGLPLVPHAENDDPSAQLPRSSTFGQEDGIDEDEDFFNQSGPHATDAFKPEFEPPMLDRKSTMQVMNTLHFQPHERNDSPASDFGNLDTVKEDADTNEADLPQDPDAQFFEEKVEASVIEATEEDLAAKWQAELGADELLEDDDFLPDDEPETQEVDPSSFFGDDDDGFLLDSEDISQVTDNIPASNGRVNVQTASFNPQTPNSQQSRYLPSRAVQNFPQQGNNYSPGTPQLTDLSPRPGMTSSVTAPYGYSPSNNMRGPPVSFLQQQQAPRSELPKAQSFADKTKGGYSSPYDLPIDLKPKKRVSMHQMSRGYSVQPPSTIALPRSASMNPQLPPPSRGSASSISPPPSSHSFQQFPGQQPQIPAPLPTQTAPPALKSKGSFFEELPMTSRAKPAGRYTPQPSINPPIGFAPPQANLPPQGQRPAPVHSYTTPAQAMPPVPTPGHNLVGPARVNPYATMQNGTPPHIPQMPSTAPRYSPAPPPMPRNMSAPPVPPTGASRYSPAPHQPPTAYVPRTSSPLATFSETSHRGPEFSSIERRSFSHEAPLRMVQTLPAPQEIDENQELAYNFEQQNSRGPISPPPAQSNHTSIAPPKRSMSHNYDPVAQIQTSPQRSFVPPPRAHTQSPGAAFTGPKLDAAEPYQRPESVSSPTSASYSGNVFQPINNESLNVGRTRPMSQTKNYISPTDGREHDPLQRWKGCPIFVWGVGGSVVTSFPVEVPRYGQGRTAPMYICSPGEVKVRNVKDVLPLQPRLSNFPGPLKGKSKKKEVISWLSAGIETMEKDHAYLSSLPTLSHQDKRSEERILLWKIMKVFVENDGVLEGNPAVLNVVRSILSPSLNPQTDGSQPLYATGADLSGIGPSAKSVIQAEPVDPASVDELRKVLLLGDRTKAVWEAVDQRLWAHAMLISNTVSKQLFKEVAREFVQKEVRNIGENAESLAALYQVFAGNFEESIDELVPPSARAGREMVSLTRSEAGPSKSALDGLDRWRETVSLILSNRSTDDSLALNALGKLLKGYGRAEAAHICFMFARSVSVFGGSDDPNSSVVLMGSDHIRQPNDFAKELEAILLSEVYEYGSSLSAKSHVPASAPHLSIYKLQHSQMLAEYGLRDKALAYCDAILASITSQTKRSPYHHSLLLSSLDDLTKRLKASPKDESNSWISKPSIEKVSGSVWNKFTTFVAGEEADGSTAAAGADGSAEVGPFARIAGGTPTISRSPSQADIYGSYNGGPPAMGGIPIPGANRGTSRYAPGASYTPPATGYDQTSSSYGSQPRQSFEQQARSSDEMRRGLYEPVRQSAELNRPVSQAGSTSNGYAPLNQLRQPPLPQQHSYEDSPYSNSSTSFQQGFAYPVTPNGGPESASHVQDSPQLFQSPNYEPVNHASPQSVNESQQNFGYEPPSNTGYEPPSTSGYEPPSYNTSYQPEPDSPTETRPNNNRFMDDDGPQYQASGSAKSGEKTKAEKDREAEELFRKAAEEDAKKDSEKPAKKGWGLGGWFGGGAKKESSQDLSSSQPGKPIRAKLGEENKFVYDPDLKRWINKDDKDSGNVRASATPPPPRGPMRMSSGGPPPSQGSRPGSSASINGPPQPPPQMERSMSSMSPSTDPQISTTPMGNGPPSAQPPPLRKADSMIGLRAPPAASFIRSVSNGSVGPGTPPSRPATGMSKADSDLDELLGGGGGSRRGAAKGKAKKGRYVDVFPTGGG